jgi:hypothetical protein
VNTRYLVLSSVLVLSVAGGAAAQVPDDAAKSSADFAAKMAEAAARAQAKVAEEQQKKAADEARRTLNNVIPIDVEVVMSRYLADKKVSSLPYVLTVNAAEHQPETRLKMGANVPVPSTAFANVPGADGKPAVPVMFNYQDVSTQIDAKARPMDDGRFEVFISVADRALAEPSASIGAVPNMPIVRTFQSSNSLVLRDGQTRQFTAAADRVTGEVVKIDVTLHVVK